MLRDWFPQRSVCTSHLLSTLLPTIHQITTDLLTTTYTYYHTNLLPDYSYLRAFARLRRLYTLYFTLYTLYLYLRAFARLRRLYTLYFIFYTLYFGPARVRTTQTILYLILYILYFIFYTLYFVPARVRTTQTSPSSSYHSWTPESRSIGHRVWNTTYHLLLTTYYSTSKVQHTEHEE